MKAIGVGPPQTLSSSSRARRRSSSATRRQLAATIGVFAAGATLIAREGAKEEERGQSNQTLGFGESRARGFGEFELSGDLSVSSSGSELEASGLGTDSSGSSRRIRVPSWARRGSRLPRGKRIVTGRELRWGRGEAMDFTAGAGGGGRGRGRGRGRALPSIGSRSRCRVGRRAGRRRRRCPAAFSSWAMRLVRSLFSW
ncbi:hypothetical protein NL676_018790 [Syzygium grande]|nr:hypothetical protein NL676_018790 [Syzygium grande]